MTTAMSTPSKDKVYYLAGPMSNIPQFNYPAFFRVAKTLRDMGYEIQSPAELDSPETIAAAMASTNGHIGTGVVNGETWGDFLARDVKLVADKVDGIIAMPTWYKSKGARLEVFVAALSKKPVWVYLEPTNSFYEIENLWQGIAGEYPFYDEKEEESGKMEAASQRS